MEGAGFVEAQSGACSICPVGGLRAHRGRVGQSPWLNNGPFPVGCGGGDVYELTPGNVIITGGADIQFSNCTFQHLGAYAASAGGGSQRVSWSQCRFRDISAGALMLGEISDCAETNRSRWNANFSVSDSHVTNLPVEYTGASSIFLGYVDSSTVSHNHIANTSYSGLTMGWGWGRTGCRRGSNRIVGNHVVNPTRVRCCDGGALYTLGPQVPLRNGLCTPELQWQSRGQCDSYVLFRNRRWGKRRRMGELLFSYVLLCNIIMYRYDTIRYKLQCTFYILNLAPDSISLHGSYRGARTSSPTR